MRRENMCPSRQQSQRGPRLSSQRADFLAGVEQCFSDFLSGMPGRSHHSDHIGLLSVWLQTSPSFSSAVACGEVLRQCCRRYALQPADSGTPNYPKKAENRRDPGNFHRCVFHSGSLGRQAFYQVRRIQECSSNCSVPNPLHILEQNLLAAAVIEFGGSAVGVPGNALGRLQRPVIFQKIRDAGRPERVRRIVSWQSGLFEPSFEHIRGVGAHQRPAR